MIEGEGKGGRLQLGDLILVSLNGHGLQMKVKPGDDREDAFFCPVDALPGRPATLLSLTHLVDDKLGPLGSRNLILVDACRDDPNPDRGPCGQEGRDMKLPRNTAVLFGCGRGEKSHGDGQAGDGHGLFTYAVLKAIRGEATRDGKVSWATLVGEVERLMAEDEHILKLLANCDRNNPYGTDEKGPYLKGTTAGGKYAANRWGLHDMHGNAWQWCEDYYDAKYGSARHMGTN